MTATQEPLFEPGWDVEPCGNGEPVRQPRGRRRVSRARRRWATWDYGRSAARLDIVHGRRIHTIVVPERWL